MTTQRVPMRTGDDAASPTPNAAVAPEEPRAVTSPTPIDEHVGSIVIEQLDVLAPRDGDTIGSLTITIGVDSAQALDEETARLRSER